MNATSLDELRAAVGSRDAGDEKMEQVRELLIGDDLRRGETRVAALEARVHELDQSVRALENDVARRLDQLHERIEAIAAEGDTQRRQAFMDLAKSVLELGDQVRGISKA